YDLRAVRILVDDVAACYAALGVVHATWMPIPSEFDDYIARPKPNDYRSLHTAVVGPEGKTLEVQIRTWDMHRQAEMGVAAHWKYKEGGGTDAALERKVAWMRRLLASGGGTDDAILAGELDSELVEDRIYVLTPKGEVIDLPAGATPLDFAYRVHTEVGHRCRGAKVDGRIVPLNHRLQSGDRVEIMTAKTGEPRRERLAREGPGRVPQARPGAQRGGGQGPAGPGTAPARPARRRPGPGLRALPSRQRRRAVRAGRARRPGAAPDRPPARGA